MRISAKDAPAIIKKLLRKKITPMIHGSPASGKSDIVRKIAEDNKLVLIDLRLAQCDISDLNGFPSINPERTKSGYVPMDTFPIESDKVPTGMNGWMLFLDEMNSAPLSVAAAAYKLILDRQVGQFNLHPQTYIVAAGNLATDKAIVNRMSTAMQSRMAHIELKIDPVAWYEWAEDNDIDHRIISYLRFKPDALYSFNPNHDDYTYSSPRTWFFASKLIKDEPITSDTIPLIATVINEGQARQFKGFTDIYSSIPSKEEILSKPDTLDISSEPSVLFAISGFIKTFINKNTIDQCMTFINRMPPEFQVIAIKQIIKKDKSLSSVKSVQDWKVKFASEFL